MRRAAIVLLLLAFITVSLSACQGKRVRRVSTDTVSDISGRWNDTDSQQVASAVVTDCLAQPWLSNWQAQKAGKKPVVIVGSIVNKSHEHINVQTFIKDIERALINSQSVRFVSSRTERNELREERRDQHDGNTAENTRAGVGQEIGANFMMKGSLNTIIDELGGSKAIFYQVNIELHNLTSNEIVWVGQKKIKKLIDKDSVKW